MNTCGGRAKNPSAGTGNRKFVVQRLIIAVRNVSDAALNENDDTLNDSDDA
jgi:hypothetical protein